MKKVFILSIMMNVLNVAAQQDPQFNMYQFNQMIINPAYAGARDGISVVANVRNQWTGIDGAPRTNCLSIHGPILKKHLGIGLTVINDQMGPRNWTAVYGNLAYIARITNTWKLSFGLNAGYSRYQFDFTKLTMKNNENLTFFSQTQTIGQLDLNSGIFLRNNSFFAGLSATHINNQPLYITSDSTGRTFGYLANTHMFFTMGKSFSFSENLIFAPTVMVRAGGRGTADLNLNFFLFKKVWLGVFYRGRFGPGFLMQYYITDKLRAGYSYDTGILDARRLGATHELMLGFDISGNKSKVISPRFL
jgi:type IX secretion system PorP/SprF family membrane protein